MGFNEKAKKEFVNDMDSFSEKRRPTFELGKTENLMTQYTSAASSESFHTDFLRKETPESGIVDNTSAENAEKIFKKQMQGISAWEHQKHIGDSESTHTEKEASSASFNSRNAENTTFSSYTNTGGGASFTTQRQENGNFGKGKVQLNSFKNRTDKQTFKAKTEHFMDTGGRAFEAVKPEENEAAASTIDDKAILATIVLHEKIQEKRKRLRDIQIEKKDEVRQLQQFVRKEQQNSSDTLGFSESSAEFTDKNERFLDKYFNAFKEKDLSMFERENLTAVPAGVMTDQTRQGIVTALQLKEEGQKSGNNVSGFNNESVFDKKSESNGKQSDVETAVSVSETGKEEKFSKTTVNAGDNKEKKSVDSYFNKESDKANTGTEKLSNKEKLELKKSEQRTAKKAESKATKRAAAMAAVSNMLRAKKELQNSVGDMNSTGNLLKDGSGGMIKAAISGIKNFIVNKMRGLLLKAASAIIGGLLHILTMATPLIMVVVIVIAIMTTFMSVFTDSTNIPDGDGYVYSFLDDEEINNIIESQYLNFPDTMNYLTEGVLRYALSKVGCAYDQAQHWNTTVDIFDCSSLAYRTYREIGIDISNSGVYSAAEICREAAESGFIAYGDLQPGDLIFYGGRDNGRYLGIYHVAIYVGDGKMVEARGRSSGVVYCDVRTANIVGYSRYI